MCHHLVHWRLLHNWVHIINVLCPSREILSPLSPPPPDVLSWDASSAHSTGQTKRARPSGTVRYKWTSSRNTPAGPTSCECSAWNARWICKLKHHHPFALNLEARVYNQVCIHSFSIYVRVCRFSPDASTMILFVGGPFWLLWKMMASIGRLALLPRFHDGQIKRLFYLALSKC